MNGGQPFSETLGLGESVDYPSVDIELPAVEQASQPAFLVPAKRQRDTAMRTGLVQNADASLRVPERHKVLSEQPHAAGCTVGHEL